MTADTADLGRRLAADVLDPLKRAFVGKDEVVDLMGVALVAGENLFLLGPPGTAKSAVVSALGRRLGGVTFEYLLTRFTEPSELFGPFDIRRLRDGDLVTNTDGMLPEATLVFLDELLNANSAILNSLLTVLNERVFRRGRETRRLPTLAVFAASNRLPDDDALSALFDRFLIRAVSDNVPADRLADVLNAGWAMDRPTTGDAAFAIDDVRRLQRSLADVDLSAVVPPLADLVIRVRNAGIAFSDRRAVKMQRLVAASALLAGRDRARPSDLWVFRHAWDTLEQQEVLASLVQAATAAAPPDPADHPRAAGGLPVAEDLARDLDDLSARLGDRATTDADRAALVDRLRHLAGRVPWVRDDPARLALQQRVDALWRTAGT